MNITEGTITVTYPDGHVSTFHNAVLVEGLHSFTICQSGVADVTVTVRKENAIVAVV